MDERRSPAGPRDPGAGHAGVVGPAVAGTWYPASAAELARVVDGLIEHATAAASPGGETIEALVAPHAGYVYSGAVAASGFVRSRGANPARVLLLGPSHYVAFRGGAVPRAGAYRTPLGDVPLDLEAIAAIENDVSRDDRPFAREHSLEAEIPFLVRCLAPGWRLVPLLVGPGTSGAAAVELAERLRPLLGPGTLVVVSSDFTHYGEAFGYVPFREDVPRRIGELDRGAIDRALARDREGFRDYVERTGATVCGRDAIEVLLALAGERWRGTLAAYDTSGRITGDWRHTVSYASLVFASPGEPACGP